MFCRHICRCPFSFQLLQHPAGSRAGVNSGTSVCEGYASLFAEIGRSLGLEVVKNHGFAKGYGYREGYDPGGTNHAWNTVRIDGDWQFFNVTWGTGYVNSWG